MQLEAFIIMGIVEGKVIALVCSNGQSGELRESKKVDRYTAGFFADMCQDCSFIDQCPAKLLKKRPSFVFYYLKIPLFPDFGSDFLGESLMC